MTMEIMYAGETHLESCEADPRGNEEGYEAGV